MREISKLRLALIPVLAEKHPTGHIGRTALMKYMYFLQTFREIPLGYDFTMYSYGPFDSDVLSDLSSAEAMGIVSSVPVSFSGGFGYEIRAGENAEMIKRSIANSLQEYERDIDWLLKEFGNLNSAELELVSTVVYVDRELSSGLIQNTQANVISRVREVKPHFSQGQILHAVDSLRDKGLLIAA